MRLFIAIMPPAEALRQLAAQLACAPALPTGVRLAPPQQWHITLRFLGEVDEARCAATRRALGAVRAVPFSLRLQNFGNFGGTVLWCGVNDEKGSLSALHTAISAALEHAGITPEKRRFSPHLTLARARRPLPRKACAAWLAAHEGWSSPPFAVRHFTLWHSELHPAGARHTPVQRWTLGS